MSGKDQGLHEEELVGLIGMFTAGMGRFGEEERLCFVSTRGDERTHFCGITDRSYTDRLLSASGSSKSDC